MRALPKWLTDPYFHLVFLGIVCVRLALGYGADQEPLKQARSGNCPACGQALDHDGQHPTVSSRDSAAPRSR